MNRKWRLLLVIAATFILIFYHLDSNRSAATDAFPYEPHPFEILDGKTHWTARREKHPVKTLMRLPTGEPVEIPKIQAAPKHEDVMTLDQRLKRKEAVKASFVHSWSGYKQHAWLYDEVVPVSGGWRNTFGGWAASLVDALDTLWIMGLEKEFEEAVRALENIDFTTTETKDINVFETTIRYLGGFLAAYDVSEHKYSLLLQKAVEVGDLLMGCFDTPNRFPSTRWDWKHYIDTGEQVSPNRAIVSEVGTLTLEFTRLSQLTGNAKYYDAVQRISDMFETTQNTTKLPGMWPVTIDIWTPDFSFDNWFTLGGMSDSVYEYLPKQFLMLGGLLDQPKKMYELFLAVAKKELFFRFMNPENKDLMMAGDIRINGGQVVLDHKGQHLGCFAGGMVGIGAKIFDQPEDLKVAEQLTDGCVFTYTSQVTGVGPEIFSLVKCPETGSCAWSEDKWLQKIKYLKSDDMTTSAFKQTALEAVRNRRLAPGFTNLDSSKYVLRPEAIESVFIMYRITGDVSWQDKAWRMFEAIEKITKTPIAASGVHDVTSEKPVLDDTMESFWMAETLKYFYLIFSDMDLVSLDEFVLNTEAHPLKRPGRKSR